MLLRPLWYVEAGVSFPVGGVEVELHADVEVVVGVGGVGHGGKRLVRAGWWGAFVLMAQGAGPGDVARFMLDYAPAAPVTQQMICCARRCEVVVAGRAAVGVFDGVVLVAAMRCDSAADKDTGLVADVDPTAQCRAG